MLDLRWTSGKMKNKNLTSLFAILLLIGCISNYPKDLTFISVRAVNQRDQPELETTFQNALVSGHNVIRYLVIPKRKKGNDAVTRKDMDGYYETIRNSKDAWEEGPVWLLLRIEFQSEVNLQQYVRSKGYNLGASMYFCDEPDGDTDLIGYPFVFWRGFDLGRLFDVRIPRDSDSDLFTYYTFLHVIWDGRPGTLSFGGPSISAPYDLRKTPKDICLEVRGGGTMGFGYRSNVVMIPRKVIAKALKRLPPPFE